MRTSITAVWTAVILAGSVGATSPVAAFSGASINPPADQLQFYQNKDGLTFANAWGDPDKVAHSNYIQLSAHTASPLHVHTSSYSGVVISGTVSNGRQAQPDRSLEIGSYWFQKGGEPHVTKCQSATESLIFVTSPGRFDIKPVVIPTKEAGPEMQKQ